MKKILPLSILSTITLLAVSCGGNPSSQPVSDSLPSCKEDNKVHLVILTGQSGARGKALKNDLTDEQKEKNEEVDILEDGLRMENLSKIPESPKDNEIKALQPKFGDSDTEFGPEMGIGEALATRYQKDGEAYKSVIVKYTACGSTFTDHWYSTSALNDSSISSKLNLTQMRTDDVSTGPLTSNLYQLIDNAIAQIEDAGYETVIDGAIFVHGEQDAKYDENMEIYESALKYFMKDLRTYVNNDELPFVITEALTNSAKYSNKLREIQKKVASEDENCSFVSTTDLYTNTFEPWHFGAESNYILGNRAASELISLNDSRKIKNVLTTSINVPLNAEVELPKYIEAEYENELTSLSKVKYTSTYDNTTLGEKTVNYEVDTSCGVPYKGQLKVNVTNDPYVDGIMNEYSSKKENKIGDIGSIYVHKGDNGLYVSGTINDKDLWTDGEQWSSGDMGQATRNDDFRIYLTTGSVEDKYTICLSAANLLRVYGPNASFTESNAFINNLYYKKQVKDVKYHVTTKGLCNVPEGNASNGFDFELFIGYSDLGISNPDDIKLCFNYNNISNPENIAQDSTTLRPSTDIYLAKNTGSNPESNIDNYYSISELI